MRYLLALSLVFHFSYSVHSSGTAGNAEDESPLFDPVIPANLPLDQLEIMRADTQKELQTYDNLIGKERGDQLAGMLISSKVERKAGCIMTWGGRTLTCVSGAVTLLSAAFGAPQWVFYVSSGVTILTPILSSLGENYTSDAQNIEKKVVKRQAETLKTYAQLNELIVAKKASDAAEAMAGELKEENLHLNRMMVRVHNHLFKDETEGDVVLDMEALKENKGKAEESELKTSTTIDPPLRRSKAKRRLKGSKGGAPPKVVPEKGAMIEEPTSKANDSKGLELKDDPKGKTDE